MRRVFPFAFVALVTAPLTGQTPASKPKEPAPQPLYALQLAADPGKTSKLTLRGIHLDKATEIRIGDPKSTAKIIGKGRLVGVSTQANADIVGGSEIDVEVTLPADVPGGQVPLTLIGPGGEGKPMMLLVNDDTPRTNEKEPNDGFKQAMELTGSRQVVQAVFKQSQDVDVYRLAARKGEKYHIEVMARRYGSPADVMLTLYDAAGRTITTGEIATGGKDPAINITIPNDGDYFIATLESLDQGGPNFVYWLALRKEP